MCIRDRKNAPLRVEAGKGIRYVLPQVIDQTENDVPLYFRAVSYTHLDVYKRQVTFQL